MIRYVTGKLAQAVLTLVLLTMLVFLLVRITGDPLELLLPLEASRETRQALESELGLDRPIHVQYLNFVSKAARFDFGSSLRSRRPAMELIAQRAPNSVGLAVSALVLSAAIGLPAGVISAKRRGQWQDSFWRTVAVLGLAMPSFWVAILLIQFVAARWRLLPASGAGSLRHVILPAVALSGSVLAGQARLMRTSMVESLGSEYVTMARAKGLPERRVVWRHAARNSLLPVLTFSGMYLAILITSAVIVEAVFAWPGLGLLVYESVNFRDFPVVQAVVLVVGLVVIAIQLCVDLLYAAIDPRVRVS